MHILAVDDSEQILLVVRHALESEGYRVSTAGNGAHALAFLASAIPDLILLDVMMPRMGGFEVLERIRGESRLVGVRLRIADLREGETRVCDVDPS